MSDIEDPPVEDGLPRRCARVQRRLPALTHGELSRLRQRLVARHVRGCDRCSDEAARQQTVVSDLAALAERSAPTTDAPGPPPELLERLLADVEEPGFRQRVAVPARGAVSGARPGLSVALILTIASLVALATWAGWRAGRARSHGRAGS